MGKRNMNYGEYAARKFKAIALMFLGIFIMLGGIILGSTSEIIGIFSLITGLPLFGYGIYTLNKLRYERENEGTRVYQYKGRFD